MLGDFANVSAQDPDWATEYTANKRKYADQPALQELVDTQAKMHEAGYFNKNFASATYDAGAKAIATGQGCALPDADQCPLGHLAEQPGQHQ